MNASSRRKGDPAPPARRLLFCAGLLGLTIAGAVAVITLTGERDGASLLGTGAAHSAGPLAIEYPPQGAVFPPDFPPPLVRWSGGRGGRWSVRVAAGGTAAETFEVTQPQWRPGAELWHRVQAASVAGEAAVTVAAGGESAVVRFRTSADAVGAPILYRAVPLPFIDAVKRPQSIRWHLLDSRRAQSPPVVLANLPVCGNCHSCDAGGSVIGLDVDYANDKGSYAMLEVAPRMTLEPGRIITWSDFRRDDGPATFGLLSRISPDGRWAISTVKDRSVFVPMPDLSYSQLFFPIRGILGWYDRQRKCFGSLAGADDANFVQSNPEWSPDGKWVYFCRAKAEPAGEAEGERGSLLTPQLGKAFAEGRRGFRFDVWRVPFAGGAGGEAEPLAGASGNGRSNYFPKASPDGRWVAFCQAANFMLLQRDSELWIVPAEGGTPRRMRCNTGGRMNSWHSWSPNGRWLVFATKARGAYTQLALAHVDANGQDSPAVLLEQAEFAGRACNIPEFVNVPQGTAMAIEERFLDHHHFMRQGQVLLAGGEAEASVPLFEKAIALNADDHDARLRLAATLSRLGRMDAAEGQFAALLEQLGRDAGASAKLRFDAHAHAAAHAGACGRRAEAMEHYRKALAAMPGDLEIRLLLGLSLAESKDLAAAEAEFRKAVAGHGESVLAHLWLADTLSAQQKRDEALPHYRAALEGKADSQEDWLLVLRRTLGVGELREAAAAALKRYRRAYPDCPHGAALSGEAVEN